MQNRSQVAEIEQLTKSFGRAVALDSVSFTIRPGELIVLLGHNGAGKTTLLDLMAGLLEPSSGRVRISDEQPGSLRARRATAYVLDTPILYDDLSLLEHLEYISRLHGVENWQEVGEPLLAQLRLTERAHDLPSRFSHGLKQRVSILLALARPFSLVLMDEPFSNLDAESKEAAYDLIERTAQSGASAVIATHYLDFVPRASRCLALRDGTLIYDGVASMSTVRSLV